MPRILCKRPSSCSVCRGRIGKGEYAEYTSATGAVHLECAGQQAQRTNDKPAKCARCRRELAAGQGALQLREEKVGDTYRKQWTVTCRSPCPPGGR